MTDLSKQQLLLLALLVSFVTSLATGIVTVSLMDQAPKGVTQTISQVIERTIQQAAPQNAASGVISIDVQDQVAVAVQKVSASIVGLQDSGAAGSAGSGLVVSGKGVVMTDKSLVASLTDPVIVLPDGTLVPAAVIQSQAIPQIVPGTDGDIVFLAPAVPISATSTVFTPIGFASAPRLGQTVFSLAGTSTPVLGEGTVTELPASSASSTVAAISTSIPASKAAIGSPLFDATGDVIGIYTSSLPEASSGTSFYPIAPLQGVIPVLK